ncbi:hypothetical protein ABVT39_000330 [Epinephelus coioides]
MANIVENFIQSPSEELLEQCTKEQLIKIAQHYSTDVEPKGTKENLKSIIKANLQECGVLMEVQGLTFEQQKELLLLQMEHDKIKFEMEAKKQLELEVIRQQTEKVKLELGYRQSLVVAQPQKSDFLFVFP